MRIYIINAVIFTIFTKEPPVTFVGTGIVFREKKLGLFYINHDMGALGSFDCY